MHAVILVIHIILAVGLIAVVLLQRSEGGALGIGGGGGMGGFMTGRGAANLLTRTTAILAACFMVTSLALAILATHQSSISHSILDQPATGSAPAKMPAAPTQAPAEPATPAAPAVPKAPIAQ